LLDDISRKDNSIQAYNDKNRELAKLKQEEKYEKEKWQNKYEDSQDEIKTLIKKFYGIKMYLVIFIFLSLFLLVFILYMT
jgi:hypothetical protein